MTTAKGRALIEAPAPGDAALSPGTQVEQPQYANILAGTIKQAVADAARERAVFRESRLGAAKEWLGKRLRA